MALVPGLVNRVSERDPSTRRVSHYLFRDFVLRQHSVIWSNASETLADAEALLARGADDRRAFVVIGEDALFYEFVLEAAYPDTKVETIGRGYQLLLRKARVPGRTHPWYFLEPRWGRDPEPDLLRFGVGPEVERHWIPLSLRLQGRSESPSGPPDAVGERGERRIVELHAAIETGPRSGSGTGEALRLGSQRVQALPERVLEHPAHRFPEDPDDPSIEGLLGTYTDAPVLLGERPDMDRIDAHRPTGPGDPAQRLDLLESG
jgi:hypothetical protein